MTLILLAFATVFIYGFVPDPGGVAMWHSNGTENGEQVVYANARLNYAWGIGETGTMAGVSGYGKWTELYRFGLADNHPSLTLNSPGENYKLVIKRGLFREGEKTPYQEETLVDRKQVSRIMLLPTGGAIEIYNGTSPLSNVTKDLQLWIDNERVFDFSGVVKMYWVYERPTGGGDPEASIGDLPKTENKILGDVFFTVDGQDVTVAIWYNGTAQNLHYTMSSETDMKLFSSKEAYFINVNNKPQIFINNSDRLYLRDILLAENDAKPAFVPHTIWDLESNELTRVQKYNSHVYFKQNDKGVMMAYFYVDEFIMDNILSTTLSYWSRLTKRALWGFWKEEGPWERQEWSFTNEDTLEYRDLTSEWYDWITGWGLISLGIKSMKYYEMPRIAHVDLSNNNPDYNITRNELNDVFSNRYEDFNELTEDSDFKLWAFALEEGKDYSIIYGSDVRTEIYNNKENLNDYKNLKIMELVYETNGKIYTTVGNDMNLIIEVHPDIDGVEKDKEKTPWWALPLFIGGAIVLFGTISKNGGFKSFSKLAKSLITIAIFAAAIYLLYLFIFTEQLAWLVQMVFRL